MSGKDVMDDYCVMGNPVTHSKSPWIHARFAALCGEPVRYGRRLVPLEGFQDAIDAFRAEGGRGCNVTVPFKFDAARIATHASERVLLAEACNTLRFDGSAIHADNTDGVGLVADITVNAGVAIAGTDLLLVGAGGAAAGVLGPLIEAGPRRIVVANRTPGKAVALAGRHAALAGRQGVLLTGCGTGDTEAARSGGFDIVVNATASSLAGGGIPVAASVLRPGALACDLMYGPSAQTFLDWARTHGAIGRDGLGMLVEQAAEAFSFWRGVRPDSATVLAELRASLGVA